MLPTLLTLTLTAQTTIRPPAIATVAGITLGQTTTEQFEKLYGKGFQHVGGHSNRGRTWYDETSGTVIDTDGFNYQIEKALGGKLDKIGEFTAKGLIQYSEKLVNKDNNRYTEWIAEFSFAENNLISFNVRAN